MHRSGASGDFCRDTCGHSASDMPGQAIDDRLRIIVILQAKSRSALLTRVNLKAPNWTIFHQSLPIRRNFNNIKHLKGGFYPKIFSYLKKYVYLCPTFSEVRPRSPRYITPDCVDAERV